MQYFKFFSIWVVIVNSLALFSASLICVEDLSSFPRDLIETTKISYKDILHGDELSNTYKKNIY